MTSPESDGMYSRKRIGQGSLLLATAIALFLCWQLAKPFLDALTWALALAVIGHPLHRLLESRLRPNIAAFFGVAAITIVLLAPGIFLVGKGVAEAGGAITTIATSMTPARLNDAAAQYPFLATAIRWVEGRIDLGQELKRAAGTLASQTPAALSGSAQAVTQFAIMLVVLFYFFRDRVLFLAALAEIIPLSGGETDTVFLRISETIQATLYGNLIVKLIQGALGGAMFWILGLPAPIPFGAAMALLAVLPLVGTSLVWGPAAFWLLLHGSWVKALILIAWGGLVVSLVDNLLYPIVLAGKIHMHSLGILLSVFGGLIAFGIAGVVLGPMILATTVALLEIWRLRTAKEPEIV